MAPLKLETAIRALRGRFGAIAFLLEWLWTGFLNDLFYGPELVLAEQLFEHADVALVALRAAHGFFSLSIDFRPVATQPKMRRLHGHIPQGRPAEAQRASQQVFSD